MGDEKLTTEDIAALEELFSQPRSPVMSLRTFPATMADLKATVVLMRELGGVVQALADRVEALEAELARRGARMTENEQHIAEAVRRIDAQLTTAQEVKPQPESRVTEIAIEMDWRWEKEVVDELVQRYQAAGWNVGRQERRLMFRRRNESKEA